MKKMTTYPQEHFVPIIGHEHLLGRLTLNLAHDGHNVEIDIVQKESRKIWSNVGRLYRLSDEQDAIDLAVQKLSEYLQNKRS